VIYTFAMYMAVTLGTGLALLLVWRQDRTQTFSGLLGVSHLVWSTVPFAYMTAKSPDPALQYAGTLALAASGVIYLTLLVLGFSHLSGRRFRLRSLFMGGAVLTAFNWSLLMHNPIWGQLFFAVLNTAVGLAVAWWMRRQGPGERLSGIFILACGLNQFTYGLMGEDGVMAQTAIAAALRLGLGMSLMYAALTRSKGAVARMRDRFFQLTESSPQGVVVLRGGELAYANPAFDQIYRLNNVAEAPASFSKEWVEFTVPEKDREQVEALVRKVGEGALENAEWSGERRAMDGGTLHLHFRAWRVEWDGEPALQLVVTDDTERREADRALQWRAMHDELTGLPNRVALLQRLGDLVEQPSRNAPFVLILVDVDRFQLFNEAHGQAVGDQVLQALAACMAERFAARAEVMRLGEDEFALLVTHDDALTLAHAITDEIKAMLREPMNVPEHSFFIDVSMGVAAYPTAAAKAEPLLQAAHAAMHEAKRLPGTSVQWATERGAEGLVALFSAEQALRSALQNDEFRLVYQPKVAASTGQLLGFEALVRWERPGVGRVSPAEFIPAAERTGLIVQLGIDILRQACRQIAGWREQGLAVVPVAVNVSPLQLLDKAFPSIVMQTLAEFSVDARLLTLEITESAAVTHMDQAQGQIEQLRQQGVEVALDDFGTGFSSLNMLRALPLRTVKIDRSLIDPMPSQDAEAVVKAICDLATVLRLDVVAEGVETEEHARAATRAGCDVLQGYLFAQPLNVDEATRWLADRY
jgi:diguanylate cyclase (GGDEF)-like protein/PAS domain S-box-containing protein